MYWRYGCQIATLDDEHRYPQKISWTEKSLLADPYLLFFSHHKIHLKLDEDPFKGGSIMEDDTDK